MAKYLVEATYTTEGARGLLKEGGSKRREAVEAIVKAVGGTLESFYFGFGSSDVYALVDGVDASTAAAVCLTVSSSGAVHTKTTVLLTPEEIDKACQTTIAFLAPGA
jgi:uncharacterized protein with GYD domain